MQITRDILMIRPLHFCKNEETAVNNFFQQDSDGLSSEDVLKQAQLEFDAFVAKLQSNGVNVHVVEDRSDVITPDSVFPNNWVSFHGNGDIALYPMFALNRRLERREDVLDRMEDLGFKINRVIDLSESEHDGLFLEGTGSIILDRENSIAYCALSERSNEELFIEFCEIFGYRPVTFHAFQTVDGKRLPVYHTNVLLSIGESFAILCPDCIDDENERQKVIRSLMRSEKDIIEISEGQMANFAGNMLQIIGAGEKRFLVMSDTAFESLSEDQISRIKKHTDIISVGVPLIEKLGGGSVRCMMAEVFLPKKEND